MPFFLSRLLIALTFAASILGSSWALQAQDGQTQDNRTQDDPGCLIRDVWYTARPAETSLTGAPGDPLRITVRLDPETLPTGYFVSTNVRVISAPAPPDILPGFPEIKVTCPEPGEYVLEVTISLLTRTSCAGVSACPLSLRRVTVHIARPTP